MLPSTGQHICDGAGVLDSLNEWLFRKIIRETPLSFVATINDATLILRSLLGYLVVSTVFSTVERQAMKMLRSPIFILSFFYSVIAGMLFTSFYRIEEAVSARSQIALFGEDKNIDSVRYIGASSQRQASFFASGSRSEDTRQMVQLSNGEQIKVVKLVSGFNTTRLLPAFLVYEIQFKDGTLQRRIAPVTPKVLRDQAFLLRPIYPF